MTEIIVVTGVFLLLLIAYVALDRIEGRKKRGVLEEPLRPRACRTCKFWNTEAAQRAFQQNPPFFAAMQTLSPNQMWRPARLPDGEPDPDAKPPYPPSEDSWEYFGACDVDADVHHRTDVCPHWEVDK